MDIFICQNLQNMLNALFSIKPKYVNRIFSGEKKYEFRTTVCKKNISKIIIYETSPISKIVGEVYVSNILKDTPEKIWNKTYKNAGIEKNKFMKYFENHKFAYAYVLENPVKYDRQISLQELNISSAPQSYLYISDDIIQAHIAHSI